MLRAFGLEPGAPAPDTVRCVHEFRDDAFQAGRACALEELRALAVDMVRVFHAPGRIEAVGGQQILQGALAFELCDTGEVVSLQVQKVECLVDQLRGALGRQRFLQQAETRCAVRRERDDFPVQDGLACGEFGDRFGDLRKPARPVLFVAAEQAHLAAVDPGDDAVAVEFDFVEPLRALRRLGHECRELRLDERGHLDLPHGSFEARRCLDLGAGFPLRLQLAVACPRAVARAGDFVHRTARCHAQFRRRHGARGGVVALDEEPVLAVGVLLAAHPHQRPGTFELVAVEHEVELAGVEFGAFVGAPLAAIPQHHSTAAVLAFGDDAFEVAVFERVILDLDGQVLFSDYETGALRYRPTLEDAVEFEPEVVMQRARRVLLDHVGAAGASAARAPTCRTSRRFGRLVEVALLSVRLEGVHRPRRLQTDRYYPSPTYGVTSRGAATAR